MRTNPLFFAWSFCKFRSCVRMRVVILVRMSFLPQPFAYGSDQEMTVRNDNVAPVYRMECAGMGDMSVTKRSRPSGITGLAQAHSGSIGVENMWPLSAGPHLQQWQQQACYGAAISSPCSVQQMGAQVHQGDVEMEATSVNRHSMAPESAGNQQTDVQVCGISGVAILLHRYNTQSCWLRAAVAH